MKPEGIEHIADILEEKRPRRPVEREHLARPPDLVATARTGRHETYGTYKGQQRQGKAYGRAVPLHTALHPKGNQTDHGTEHYHGVQPHQPPAEKATQRKASPAPTVVVGIGQHKPRKHKEKIDSQISVVDHTDQPATGKGIALEHMIPHHEQRSHAAQPVEQGIMRLGIGIGRRRINRLHTNH